MMFPMISYLTFYISTFIFFVRVNPYTASNRPLTTKSRVQFQTGVCRIYGEPNGTATEFSSEKSIFFCQYLPFIYLR